MEILLTFMNEWTPDIANYVVDSLNCPSFSTWFLLSYECKNISYYSCNIDLRLSIAQSKQSSSDMFEVKRWHR